MILKPLPLTTDRFSEFGDVVEAAAESRAPMNSDRFERFANLAEIEFEAGSDGRPAVSIARCRTATSLPVRIDMLERHPLGSQLFMPLSPFQFYVVVAPAEEGIRADEIQAFVTNGKQGVNYQRGVWHMPMIALQAGHEFLIVDRAGAGANCDEHYLSAPLTLQP